MAEASTEFLSFFESQQRAIANGLATSIWLNGIPLLGPTPLGLIGYLSWPVLPFVGFYLLARRIDLKRDVVLLGVAAFIGAPVGFHLGFWVGQFAFFHRFPFSDSVALAWFALEGFYGFVVVFSALALKHVKVERMRPAGDS